MTTASKKVHLTKDNYLSWSAGVEAQLRFKKLWRFVPPMSENGAVDDEMNERVVWKHVVS